jgi:hypothetical protein
MHQRWLREVSRRPGEQTTQAPAAPEPRWGRRGGGDGRPGRVPRTGGMTSGAPRPGRSPSPSRRPWAVCPQETYQIKILVDAGIFTRDKRVVWAHYGLVRSAMDAPAAVLSTSDQHGAGKWRPVGR